MKVSQVRFIAGVTVLLLVVAALGLSKDFRFLDGAIAVGFFALAVSAVSLRYLAFAATNALLGILFVPWLPMHLPRHIWVLIDVLGIFGVAYFSYWSTNSYWKGTRFEQYVTTFFPEPKFLLTDRTRDISKFTGRRVESDTHPDLVFRNGETGNSFAVECKWRAQWARGRSGELGLWWNLAQWNRYRAYAQQTGFPVWVAFGIGGSPERPREVYLIDLERLHYPFLRQELIMSGKTRADLVRS
ncbi:MAG TPA: hypothetical protein VF803_01715 [Candidatus Paceibacterota bacterium]